MSESEQPVVGDAGLEQTAQTGAQSVVASAVTNADAPSATITGGVPKPRRKGRSDEEIAYWRGFVDEWHRLVASAQGAGAPLPTVRGFCDERGLREPSFYWWRRELAIRDGKPLPSRRFVDPVRVSNPTSLPQTPAAKDFVQLRVRPSAQALSSLSNVLCELVVGKVVVRVSPGFDADELSRLLDLLATRPR